MSLILLCACNGARNGTEPRRYDSSAYYYGDMYYDDDYYDDPQDHLDDDKGFPPHRDGWWP